ncbi:hypothetical protein BJY52DRAFT_1419405 [Lactarius psammicola]|nr:hypothetical protein BJY52DRAFT_1419405 [Lactarius psammicola]
MANVNADQWTNGECLQLMIAKSDYMIAIVSGRCWESGSTRSFLEGTEYIEDNCLAVVERERKADKECATPYWQHDNESLVNWYYRVMVRDIDLRSEVVIFSNAKTPSTYVAPSAITDYLTCCSARPCKNVARQRADASSHTDEAFGDPVGPFAQIGSTCPSSCAPTLHRHCATLPPTVRSTSQAGTGIAYAQVARTHYTGQWAWQAQSGRRRAARIKNRPGYREFGADYELILAHIVRSHSRNRGSNGACTHTAIIDHSNPGAWHGTSAIAPATTVACANDAEVLDRLLGALDFHKLIFGRLMGLADALQVGWTTPKASADSLVCAENAGDQNLVGLPETKTENAENPPSLSPPDTNDDSLFAAVANICSAAVMGTGTLVRCVGARRPGADGAVFALAMTHGAWHPRNIQGGYLLDTRHPSRNSRPATPPTSTMSQIPSTSTSSTNFHTIFTTALEAYKRQTKKDIASHPLAIQLKSCDSPDAILTVLRAQVQAFDQSQIAHEKLTKWLDPTVNVLYAFTATLGNGLGLVFPPSNAIFAGIGVLLQAVKDVRASRDALVDLFGRLEYFFKRLEKYVEVRPTTAMTDIIVKIMVEVLSILGIVTKEVRQGRTKKYLKRLVGRNDVEDALQRLDKLTQEEARMAAAEALEISRGIHDKVEGVDHKVGSVIEGNELRKDLRKWIAPPDPSVNYNAASGAHHEGTAAWCTKGNTLADWKASGSLLWIHGKPGSGKTILSSVIIRDLKSVSIARSAYLAYFYFDFKDTAKQDSRALLSSLLVQLSDQSDIFCDALFSLYSAHKRGSEQPTNDSLSQCLKYMLATERQVPIYLIMDALDECPNGSGLPSPREKLLDLVDELVKLRHPTLRLCLTSRPEFDIRTALQPLATQQKDEEMARRGKGCGHQ